MKPITKNLLFFIDPQSYENLGVYDYSLLGSLSDKWRIVFFCSSLFQYDTISTTIAVKRLFKYNRLKGVYKAISYLMTLWQIAKEVKRRRPSVIHIQWLRIPMVDTWFASLLQRRYGPKIVFTAHNILPHDSGAKYSAVFRRYYNKVDAIIVHDINSKNELSDRFGISPHKIRVIRHGLLHFVVKEDLIRKEIDDIKKRYHLGVEKKLFVVLGIQSPYKGTDVLLSAWNSTPELRENKRVVLIVAGRCQGFDYSAAKGANNLFVEDCYISEERLQAFLRVADLVLLPYKKISQSGVLLSAIDTETPFFVTRIGGLAEPLDIADVGWSIESCEEELIRLSLVDILSNQEMLEYKKNNKEAWRELKNAFSWGAIGMQTSSLYDTLQLDKYWS